MQKSSWLPLKFIPPAILVVSLMAVYLTTMAPGLTWANDGADGGDLIAAAATAGVAHPTGYPTYLLLARIFQYLPIGNLAYRTNFMSAIVTVVAGVLIFRLVTRSLSPLNPHDYWLAGLVSAYAFGLSPLIWSQAVITEVYALHGLFVVLILNIYATKTTIPSYGDGLGGLILGIAMGNHISIVFLVPAAFILRAIHRGNADTRPGWGFDWKSLLRQFAFLVLGLFIYLILPLRASAGPPVNWGNAVTLDRFYWLISGQLYQSNIVACTVGELWIRVQAWAFLLLEQLGFIGVGLSIFGLALFFRPTRIYLFTLWGMIAYTAFALIYATFDSYLYLIPAYISLVIWIGLGMGGLMNMANRSAIKPGAWISFLSMLYFLGLALGNWSHVDASHDARAEDFGEQVMTSAPANAIVFADGDRAVFTMWYFHFALGQRPDLIVIASDLLHFDWYQDTLRSTYPSLALTESYPWPETVIQENPLFPVCYVQYVENAIIDCSLVENAH